MKESDDNIYRQREECHYDVLSFGVVRIPTITFDEESILFTLVC